LVFPNINKVRPDPSRMILRMLFGLFQIKSVIVGLIDRLRSELMLPDLELENEQGCLDQQNHVNTPAHSRNRVFEINLTAEVTKRSFENPYFFEPGAALVGFN